MLILLELFGVAFLFIWCMGTEFPHLFFSTWPLQPIVFIWRQNSPSTGIVSWSRIDTTWMRCASLDPVMLINRKFDISCKLDIWRNLSTYPSQLHSKENWSFATQSRSRGRSLMGLTPPKQSSNSPPPILNMKHYKTVMFVQISECQAPLHKCKAPSLWKTFWWRSCCHTKLFNNKFFGNNG